MLEKLKKLIDLANSVWHEDKYTIQLNCNKDGWEVVITHDYTGKNTHQPTATVFSGAVTDETVDAVIGQIKAKFIARAIELADFRKKECEEIYRKMTEANSDFTKRLFILEEMKKV